jgi:hypothetical protein
LLADPLSELTRKRQTALLLTATVGWLLSAGLVTVTELKAEDWAIHAEVPWLAKWLAFLITAYLLSVYLLGVWADWTIAKAKGWSPLASIENTKAAMTRELETWFETNSLWEEKAQQAINQKETIRQELNQRIDENRARSTAARAELDTLTEKGLSVSSEESNRKSALMKEVIELGTSLMALQKERYEKMAAPTSEFDEIIREWDEAIARQSTEVFQPMRDERKIIDKTIPEFSRLTRLRLILEIWIPSAYAASALIVTVVLTYVR